MNEKNLQLLTKINLNQLTDKELKVDEEEGDIEDTSNLSLKEDQEELESEAQEEHNQEFCLSSDDTDGQCKIKKLLHSAILNSSCDSEEI